MNVKGAPLYAILGGEVTRGADKNGTVAIYNAEYDVTLLYLHCENSIVRRGDTVEAGDMIAKEGKTNISGGANTHYTHVELRKGRHTSSSPYRDTVLTSDCPYAVMQQALGVIIAVSRSPPPCSRRSACAKRPKQRPRLKRKPRRRPPRKKPKRRPRLNKTPISRWLTPCRARPPVMVSAMRRPRRKRQPPLCRKPRCRRPTPERPQRRDFKTTFIS
ncbi:MAG: M23 family metallopeptidase [Christensenellales bacterium]